MLKVSKCLCLLALASFVILAKADWDDDDFFKNSGSEEDEKVPFAASRTLDTGHSNHSGHNHTNHSSHSHSEHHHIHAPPPNQAPVQVNNWDPKQTDGVHGTRYAAHNQSCGPNRAQCIPQSNLVCSETDGTGRCICGPGYVYVKDTETCWLIPRSQEDPCGHNIQCHAGKWGELSICSKTSARCECYDTKAYGKRNTTLVNGVCHISKTRGDLCHTHEECDNTIEGDAYCQPGDFQGPGGNFTGSCQCRDTHTWFNTLNKCLRIATKLDDDCVVTHQCTNGTLGYYSVCNLERGKCECKDYRDGQETKYYEQLRKCFLKKEYNDTCTEHDECRANLGPDVMCGPTEEYPHEKVCHCPKGKTCRNSGFSTMFGKSSYTTGMACAATAIGLTLSMKGIGV